jgi:hypothetical protein
MGTPVRSTGLGAGLGAGLMFLLDPARGGRRRALVRDKFTRAAHWTSSASRGTERHVAARLAGVAAKAWSRVHRDTADDCVIQERVRTELGRVASHPRAIGVHATDGSVTLTGDALASEVAAIDAAVRRVRGVANVANQLTIHTVAGRVPALHWTSTPRRSRRSSWIGRALSPGVDKIVAAVGLAASLTAAAIAIRRTSASVSTVGN